MISLGRKAKRNHRLLASLILSAMPQDTVSCTRKILSQYQLVTLLGVQRVSMMGWCCFRGDTCGHRCPHTAINRDDAGMSSIDRGLLISNILGGYADRTGRGGKGI